MIATPPAIVLFNFILWTVGTKIAKCVSTHENTLPINRQRLLNRIAILSGIMLYIIYPMIISLLFQSVHCFTSLSDVHTNDTPVSRLRIYPNIECEGDKYTYYFYGVFIPAIIVYVFLIPISALHYMCKNSNMIYLSS